VGHAYFQQRKTPPVFPKNQLASLSIGDPTVGVTLSPQINASAPNSSLDTQLIWNQNIGNMSKDPAATVPMSRIRPF
jgi:hypothetical protein